MKIRVVSPERVHIHLKFGFLTRQKMLHETCVMQHLPCNICHATSAMQHVPLCKHPKHIFMTQLLN